MEYHEPTPSVLMLHDGELDTLTAVIESLGGVDRRGNPSDLDRAQAWDVIVASAGRMLELDEHLSDTLAVRIAVLDRAEVSSGWRSPSTIEIRGIHVPTREHTRTPGLVRLLDYLMEALT